MKAMLLREFGGPDAFQFVELEEPKPGPGEVLIRAAASSVNPVDCRIRSGAAAGLIASLPKVLHGDVSGTIEAVGEGVSRFSPGDKVFGCIGGYGDVSGALAELVCADERLLAHAPQSIPLADAAALPLVSITVEEGFERCAPVCGELTLIHAGTGGVGHMAVQLAKTRGARAVATCSSEEKAAAAKRLGADEIVMYREEEVDAYVKRLTGGQGFGLVFDTVGGQTFDRSLQALRMHGSLISVQARGAHDLAPAQARAATIYVVFMLLPLLHNIGRERHGRILEQIAVHVDESRIRPLIDGRRFGLPETAEAHRLLESGQAVGKVVIEF